MKKFLLLFISILSLSFTYKIKTIDKNVFSLEVSNLKNIDTLFIASAPDKNETYKLTLKNGTGKIEIPIKSNSPRLFTITTNIEKSDLFVLFYVEKGKAYFSDINDGIRGTLGNNAIADSIKKDNEISRKIDPENKWWRLQLKQKNGNEITKEDKEFFTKISQQYSKTFTKERAMSNFTKSIGKPGELYFLYKLIFSVPNTDEEKLDMISKASNIVRGNPIFLDIKEKIKKRKFTQKGGKYIDFNAVYLMETNKNTNLSDLLKNNKEFTVIDFWASWCHPCVSSLPIVKKMYEKYGQKANFINVAVMDKNINKLQKLSNEKEISWVNLYDQDNVIPGKYGMNSIPTTILLDKNGLILLRTNDILEIEKFLK